MAENEEPHTRSARVVFAHRSAHVVGLGACKRQKCVCGRRQHSGNFSVLRCAGVSMRPLMCVCVVYNMLLRSGDGRPTPALDPCPSHSHPRAHPADLKSPLSQFLWCKFVIKLSRGSHQAIPTTSRTCAGSLWRGM
jgi:hypothetical protein